jgi:hypothetical protein
LREEKEMENCSGNNDKAPCPSCGEGNEKRNQFCVHCGNPFSKRKEIRFRMRYLLFGIIGFALIGTILFSLMGLLSPKLVGKVNGEGMTRKEFSIRLNQAKKFYEYQYGQGIFDGEIGKENLNRLKSNILDEMVLEKILLQEAKKAGYTSAPEEEIENQLKTIEKESRLSDADLIRMTGGRLEDLKSKLRIKWIASQFIEKAVLKEDQTNAQQRFVQWITQAKANAKIETYEKLDPVLIAKASCCRSGCGGGRIQPLDPKIEKEAKAKALEYYEMKTKKKGASAQVTNFGCHIQVDIIEEGKIMVSLTYRNGEVQEI